MKNITIRPGFLVTSEPINNADGFNMTDEISDLIDELYEGVLSKKRMLSISLRRP